LNCAIGALHCRGAFAAEKKFPFGNSKGRAPTALQLLLFEEMVPEVGVEPTRFNGGGFSCYFGFRRRRICDVPPPLV
jgi:hypothetical protein